MGFLSLFGKKGNTPNNVPQNQADETRPSTARGEQADQTSVVSPQEQRKSEIESVAMVSIPYTIEPGFHACNSLLSGRVVGGIGVVNQINKFHDYESYDEYPGLSDFLDTLTFVDGEYPSYCTTSAYDVNLYFNQYINRFIQSKDSNFLQYLMVLSFKQHVEVHRPYEHGTNIIIGQPYYNFLFYKLSYMMAIEIVGQERIDACLADLGPSQLSGEKRFVNEFDHFKRCTFIFDLPDKCFHAEDGYANAVEERMHGPIYHCSKNDFEEHCSYR